jgi:hypothetical protein
VDDGLPSKNVACVTEVTDTSIWSSSINGVSRHSPAPRSQR